MRLLPRRFLEEREDQERNSLTVEKNKFVLSFCENFRGVAEGFPSSRKKRLKDNMIEMAITIEVWKSITPYVMNKKISVDSKAAEALKNLSYKYREHRRKIRSAESRFKKNSSLIPVPLKSTPYSHQVRAFGFSSSIDCSALLMEQGTGKTLTSIAIVGKRYLDGNIKKVLVVCPKSVIPVWPKELRKHADFPYSWNKVGKSKQPIRDKFGKGVQVLICNYDKLSRSEKDILKWNPEMIILDEGHRIKNRSSKRSKCCFRIGKKVKYKLILSGTILGQKLQDVWSPYNFLNSNVFGCSYKNFENRYCRMGGFKKKEIKGYKNIDEFSEKLHSIAFRCTKRECLDLPKEVSQIVYCYPSKESKKIYKEMDLDFFTSIDGEEVEVDLEISKIIKLRQIVGGVVKSNTNKLLPVGIDKISCLQEIIEDRDWNSKMAIFVCFTHEIEIIGSLLNKMGKGFIILSGKTPDSERFLIEETFKNDNSIDIIIIQVNTGGEGLDFTSASTGLFYSPTFSIIQRSQLKARIHRIGQENKVNYIDLVMKGTIDEKILEYLEEYGDLTSRVLDRDRNYKLERVKKPMDKELKEALDEIEREINNQPEENIMAEAKKREKPTKAKSTKGKDKKVSKVTKEEKPATKKSTKGGYTATTLAEEIGVSPGELRKKLRDSGIEKPEGGWVWNKKTDPQIKEIKQLFKAQPPAKKSTPKKEEQVKKTKKKSVKKTKK